MAIRWLGVVVAAAELAAGLSSGAARADDSMPSKLECIAADTDGQSLRLGGKMHLARKRFGGCIAPTCPKVVRQDCFQRIDEIDAMQPTVVFRATNGDGRDLVAVHVFVDDVLVSSRLDGRAISVDPGEHRFVFKALGRLSTEMTLVLREGDKERHGVVLRTDSGHAAVAPPPAPDATPRIDDVIAASSEAPLSVPALTAARPEPVLPAAESPVPGSETRTLALAAGGLGAVGVVVGSIFGLMTISKWNSAQRQCGSACPTDSPARQEQADAATDGAGSTVAFLVGAAGLATGAVLWFTAPDPSRSQVGLTLAPRAGPSPGQFLLQGRF
jgi:hypothetical protein